MGIPLIMLVLSVALALSWPAGRWMTWAMNPGSPCGPRRLAAEQVIGRLGGPLLDKDQTTRVYGLSLLAFNLGMFIFVLILLNAQAHLPFNPDHKGSLDPGMIFHTAASFTSNTDAQHYSGEVSLSHFSQIFGLMWLQFLSAATGIAALAAMARGLAGLQSPGNFYRDLMRATVLILLPGALCLGILLVLGGVPMTGSGSVTARTLEGSSQIIARGPVAALLAIKQLGTNGGGFFGANSAHPFENPTALTNLLETICLLVLPIASVWMFGRITGRMAHARVLFGVMFFLLLIQIFCASFSEQAPGGSFRDPSIVQGQGQNLEGKELRFGSAAGPLWASLTTSTSNGSVNCMHDSLKPLTVLVLLVGMWLNVIFGGVGVGLINLFLYIITGVFICGMMVGRSPEYLSRKVETREMKLALLAILLHPLLILVGTALFAATPLGAQTVGNPGSRGFSEILYEFTSAAANNGSGLEGLLDQTTAWNVSTGITMILSRFIPILFPLAIAGSLVAKRPSPESAGTFRTDTVLFGAVLLGTVLFVGALLFLPVAVLGPIAEHLAVAMK